MFELWVTGRPFFFTLGVNTVSYTVLARRYRSTNFDDIVGQEPIALTLRNAIDSNRTAHAYLFCGTRGVGKTSMARIFARELNKSEDLQEHEEINRSILRGEDLDVIEIDGASNRGVQEARDLIASAGLSPTRCAYRVFIIDEVHMLTTPAFNALLKTMEEPPSHVKFILCTTEPHKVPATIQSRCQRFDFKAIPTVKIANHLEAILVQENIKADLEVITQVARLGNGSMRDSLSILDRLLSTGSSEIKLNEIEELLGLPSQLGIINLGLSIVESDMKTSLEISSQLIATGNSLDRILEELSILFRNTLIAKVCGSDSDLLEVSEDSLESLIIISKKISEGMITHFIALCDASSRQVRRGGSGRALFDATVARMCLASEIIEAGSVLTKNQTHKNITKKKRIATNKNSTINDPHNPKINKETLIDKTDKPITWEQLISTISSTPGLKKVAQSLILKSFDQSKLVMTVSEEGYKTINYILAQRHKIEQSLLNKYGKIYSIIIEVDEVDKSSSEEVICEEVIDDELVNAARGLFDSKIINVKNISRENE